MSEVEGKVCIVTGSNSGIGKETTIGLAQMQANVVMVVRSLERGNEAKSEIVETSGNSSVDLMLCDLSSMGSIQQFAEEFLAKYDRLHVLINNAGVFLYKHEVTVDGFERTLAVDYLAPFLLTNRLLPLLRKSAPSRIINISSRFHRSGKVDFDYLQRGKMYSGVRAYANAKLMVTMFTYELARRLEGTGVTSNVVLPSHFVATNIWKKSGSRTLSFVSRLVWPFLPSARKAAETPVYLASSKDVENTTGKCFSKMKETTTPKTSYDQQLQKRLWNETAKILGLSTEIQE